MSRVTEFDCDPLFTKRWSPRAMSGEVIDQSELMKLFEAARWAPSSSNGQPWRFIYAKRDTPYWDTFFDLLVEGNQNWCKNASVLILLISKKTFEYKGRPDNTHSLSAGAAWENLALQGSIQNLVIHGLGGFDYDAAAKYLNLSDDFKVEMMIAVGKPGKKEDLPEPLQEREQPSERKPLSEIVFEGEFTPKP